MHKNTLLIGTPKAVTGKQVSQSQRSKHSNTTPWQTSTPPLRPANIFLPAQFWVLAASLGTNELPSRFLVGPEIRLSDNSTPYSFNQKTPFQPPPPPPHNLPIFAQKPVLPEKRTKLPVCCFTNRTALNNYHREHQKGYHGLGVVVFFFALGRMPCRSSRNMLIRCNSPTSVEGMLKKETKKLRLATLWLPPPPWLNSSNS